MLSLLRLERKQKNYSNPFRIRIFLFLSYSFGIETINTFIHSVVPSKTIPDSRPKWTKCILVFRPKRLKNPTRWDGTYLYGYIREYPPGKEFSLFSPLIFFFKFKIFALLAEFGLEHDTGLSDLPKGSTPNSIQKTKSLLNSSRVIKYMTGLLKATLKHFRRFFIAKHTIQNSYNSAARSCPI